MEDGQTDEERLLPTAIDPFDRQTTLAAALYLSSSSGRAFSWDVGDGLTEPESSLLGWFGALASATVEEESRSIRFVPADVPTPEPIQAKPVPVELELGLHAMPSLVFVLAAAGWTGKEVDSLEVRGGTHTDPSLSYEHLAGPFSWLLESAGLRFELRLKEAGYANERGLVHIREIRTVDPGGAIELGVAGPLARIEVVAAASGVANFLHQRLASETASIVRSLGLPVSVHLMKLRARRAGSVVSVSGRLGRVPVVSFAAGTEQADPESLGRTAGVEFMRLVAARDGFPTALLAFALVILAGRMGDSHIFVEKLPPWWSGLGSWIRRLSPRVFTQREVDEGVWLDVTE